jgi:hypothetical protein
VTGYDIASGQWALLGTRAPASLVDARLQLHHLVQTIASFGQALLEPREDDSHRNMGWDEAATGFRSWPAGDGRSVVVRTEPLEVILDAPGSPRSLALEGKTLGHAYRWLEEALDVEPGTLAPPEYEIPGHAVASGAPFDADPAALAELGRWYANAHLALGVVASQEAHASAVRCWPHHFDIATLIPLSGHGPDGSSRTVGCGMTPGDGSYPVPYWYVTPWPYDFEAERPALDGGGHWHAEGWLGAVLTADRLVQDETPAAQASRAGAFLSRAVRACIQIAPRT